MASYTKLLITSADPLTANITGTDAHDKAIQLAGAIKAMAGGVRNGSIISQVDGVRATGTVTLTYAKLVAAETLTIGGQTLTIRASGATLGTEWNKTDDATVTAANLAACINANTVLSTYLSATSALGVVTIVCKAQGLIGNCIDMVVSASDPSGYALSAARLAGGTNGTVSTLSFGL